MGTATPTSGLAISPGLMNDSKGYDIDGVLLGQDEDNDGTLEINRNLNDLADYEEPFLMFDVEPNVYVYGLDRNHNDEPDHREDDGEVDYPYDYDQRGLPPLWTMGFDAVLVAGGGPLHDATDGRQRSQSLHLCANDLPQGKRGAPSTVVFRKSLPPGAG